jgi:hypothetical protein
MSLQNSGKSVHIAGILIMRHCDVSSVSMALFSLTMQSASDCRCVAAWQEEEEGEAEEEFEAVVTAASRETFITDALF